MNRFINDIDEVYGVGMTEQELIDYENKLKREITRQETKLSKRLP